MMAARSTVNKNAFANYVHHASTLNRVHEEQEMWRARELEKSRNYYFSDRRHYRRSAKPLIRGRLLSDTLEEEMEDRQIRRRRKEEESESHRERSPVTYHWTQELMKAEENDPHRWGHSGYKEQHPEEFVSSDEEKKKREAKKQERAKVKKERKKEEREGMLKSEIEGGKLKHEKKPEKRENSRNYRKEQSSRKHYK